MGPVFGGADIDPARIRPTIPLRPPGMSDRELADRCSPSVSTLIEDVMPKLASKALDT